MITVEELVKLLLPHFIDYYGTDSIVLPEKIVKLARQIIKEIDNPSIEPPTIVKELSKEDIKNRFDHPFYREGYLNASWNINGETAQSIGRILKKTFVKSELIKFHEEKEEATEEVFNLLQEIRAKYKT